MKKTATLNHAIRKGNFNIRFRRARHVTQRLWHCRRINRNGVIYYARRSYPMLNPMSSPSGCGLQFVKGDANDPTGVFFTDGPIAKEEEVAEAIKAYCFEFGTPHAGIVVIPATCWVHCYERSANNIEALRRIGAPLPHEDLSTE